MDETNIRLKILASFLEFLSEDQKKRSLSQNFNETRCKSTKITKIRAVNINLGVLGLDLQFNSPESVNFFGAQSSLGGHNFRLRGHKQLFGRHGLGMSPVALGLVWGCVFELGPGLGLNLSARLQLRDKGDLPRTITACIYLILLGA